MAFAIGPGSLSFMEPLLILTCTICDCEKPDAGLIFTGPELVIDERWHFQLSICRDCAAYCCEAFGLTPNPFDEARNATLRSMNWPKFVKANAIDSSKPSKIMACSFCRKRQDEVRKLFQPCVFFEYCQNGQTVCERVAHIDLFLAAQKEAQPRRVFDCFICDGCVQISR
ncbi:MAG: hypothetical protein NT000_06160 [Proteobacteria bacterium]|nr:hypothetical protein [Pseudomonadota bacterium]